MAGKNFLCFYGMTVEESFRLIELSWTHANRKLFMISIGISSYICTLMILLICYTEAHTVPNQTKRFMNVKSNLKH